MQNTSMSQLQTYFDSIWDSSDSKPCRGSRTEKMTVEKIRSSEKTLQRATEKISCRIRKTKLGRTDI